MYPQTFYGKMRVSLFRQEVRPVICCISDIHGELDKLEQMLELIRFSGEEPSIHSGRRYRPGDFGWGHFLEDHSRDEYDHASGQPQADVPEDPGTQ